MSSPKQFTVREAAERLQVTARTLKYYEELGLATPSRSESRYRLYSNEDLERLVRVIRMRTLGFSLQTITELMKLPLVPEGKERKGYSKESFQQAGAALSRQIESLDARIAVMRKEIKQTQTLRQELSEDLDYILRRAAGERSEDLLPKRMAARKAGKIKLKDDLAP